MSPNYESHQTGSRSGQMTNALNLITSGGPISTGVLQTVLKCSENPKDLLALYDCDLIPDCMRILKEYRKELPILEGEKGVLCLKVLLLSFQVALLGDKTDLLHFIARASLDPSLKLTGYVVSMIHAQVYSREEWITITRLPLPLIMPRLSPDNVTVLLCYLYEERVRFLMDCSARPDRWNGFSLLLYGIWGHMRGRGGLDAGTIGLKLRDIACRFALIEPSDKNEELLTTCILVSAKMCIAGSGSFDASSVLADPPTPELLADTLAIVRLYVTRLSRNLPALDLSLHLLEWTTLFVYDEVPDLMLAFFRVSYARLWTTLDPTREKLPMTSNRIHDIVDYTGQLISFTATILNVPTIAPATKEALFNVIRQNDIFGLLPRVVFFHLTDKISLTPKDRQTIGTFFDGLFGEMRNLGNVLSKTCKTHLSKLKKSHVDWLKAAHHLQERCHTSDQSAFIQNHVSKCQPAWTSLGALLLGGQVKAQSKMCSYPRCPYPNLAGGVGFTCEGCDSATNCSYGCQNLQWGSHLHGASGVSP
ncbi:hypothetical protein FS749_001640 [Ceratobasidium sp. UAMH 11750]|nr:hypothetical protein FS749_001640 [Ceratobasidium sp. UAMH 11750]